MAAATTLTRLLGELKSVSSPLERMRVAARAWRTLRRLRPEERQVLATQVGLEGAEEILEGLGGKKRLAPALVLQALEKARKADPSQLRGLVKGLKDRDTRGAILQRWIDSVSEGLGGEEEKPPEAPAEAVPEKPPAPESTAKPEPPQSIPVAKPLAAIPVVSAPPRQAPKPEPEVKLAAAKPEHTQPRRVPPPVPLQVPVPVPRSKPAVKPVRQAAPQSALASEQLAGRLHRIDGLMARFRLLRSGLDGNGINRLGDVAQLLDAFPAGWARRRALAALLRHHIPGNLEKALAFIDEQESSAARRWCLGTILDHWELSSEQQDQLRQRRRA